MAGTADTVDSYATAMTHAVVTTSLEPAMFLSKDLVSGKVGNLPNTSAVSGKEAKRLSTSAVSIEVGSLRCKTR